MIADLGTNLASLSLFGTEILPDIVLECAVGLLVWPWENCDIGDRGRESYPMRCF